MIYYLKICLITLARFLAIDFVWLGFVARDFYRWYIGLLLKDEPNW